MKFFIFQYLIMISVSQTIPKTSMFISHPLLSNESTINHRGRIDIIDSLKKALFSPSADLEKVKVILKQIRTSKNFKLIEPLQDVYVMVQQRTSASAERKLDIYLSALYEIEASIIFLQLDKNKLGSFTVKAKYLFQRVETKLKNKQVINAEMILLKENSSEITKQLLSIIDSSVKPNMKRVALSILKDSKDPTVEKEILKRIDRYENESSLYSNMLSILSEKGTTETFKYMQKKLNENTIELKTVIKIYLKRLSENTNDSSLKERINESIEN